MLFPFQNEVVKPCGDNILDFLFKDGFTTPHRENCSILSKECETTSRIRGVRLLLR